MKEEYPLTKEEFDSIYSKVPRLNVEIIVQSPKGIYLTKRSIEPCKGQWHIPGGTVYFGEALLDSVKRVAKKELNIDVKLAESIGFIEYPSHYKSNMDHPFGVVFLVNEFSGEISYNEEAQNGGWFKELPENMHADQDEFLVKYKLIKRLS